MSAFEAALLALLIFAVAALYSSVGQAGASGYLAAMLVVGLPAAMMRPAALLLNVGVATVASLKYIRAGAFSWRILLPFALASVPMSFVGGSLVLPAEIYKPVIGVVLILAALRLLAGARETAAARPMPLPLALAAGGVIGLASGLTGIGGGIFLMPLLLFTGWATPRVAAGVSAVFILLNSLAALLSQPVALSALPPVMPIWALCAIAGGWIGATYGSQALNPAWTRRGLAVVLLVAAARTLFV